MIALLKALWHWATSWLDPTPFMEADMPGFKADPDEPKVYLADLVDDAADLADEANGDLMNPRWLTKAELQAASAERLEREQRRRAAWEKFGVANPDLLEIGEKVIAYPPKVEEESAQAWVTAELERRTGGITRHPMDKTSYPTPPTEQDRAARECVNREISDTFGSRSVARGYFSHGMSMRYLDELLERARRKDPTLTDEQLMGLRSRGLI